MVNWLASARTSGCREDGSPPMVGHSVQLCLEWTGVAEVERWSLTVNPVSADPSSLLGCNRAGSALSADLDLAMVELDDVADLLEDS